MAALLKPSLRAEVVNFCAGSPSAEEIAKFQLSADLQKRYAELSKRRAVSALTPEEEREWAAFARVDETLKTLKALASLKLISA